MQWDLYCRVVDNFGDIGVAWRLAADLAARGESVRLALDDPTALAWMAPEGARGVDFVGWNDGPSPAVDVVVELFGGGRPARAWASDVGRRAPLLVNVEHLTAETYAERSHALPSPTRRPGEPASTTWFYFPGFSAASGGLLRERGLLERRSAFGVAERNAWLASFGIALRPNERCVSLFCYRDAPVAALLDALVSTPTLVLATPGPATDAVRACLGPALARGALRAVALPYVAQPEFDRVLWSSSLNFVRGEDSLVRAIWAGAPFVWQPYVQDDGAHRAKLAAFLDRFLDGAPAPLAAAVRAAFVRWSGFDPADAAPIAPDPALHAAWSEHCRRWRDALAAQPDLVTRLVAFVGSKR